ncbi:uncharacterized protein Dwil_GK14307 [Drosophila willistoni]|uniref:GRIP domain-containing protein n=1 Tax=Drosophila willistoni TaxID=7260 RepID=B4NIH2_DROWI|nr:GRIP and coiled-coil domain-containing protein 1 [Drosophila willistoni]EDW84795.1 uncharacterized protein Dwil_GK14307 [Drosophila willistoni]
MEKRQRELEALVSSQKEQLNRYEKRLKDVVTAYKGLLKEKEALETSLVAHAEATAGVGDTESSTKSTKANDISGDSTTNDNEEEDTATRQTAARASSSSESQLQTQIITLMNSLATLSAEKSRMEASFQADKKQLRSQIVQKEQDIREMQLQAKDLVSRAKGDVDEVKAKWIIERQEREKETSNQMLMIRELQKLYADERHLKESIEMQLNNFKTQFASNEAENKRLTELQFQLKEAKDQLKVSQAKVQEANTSSTTASDHALVLQQVSQEMQQLKDQHAEAIKQEQRRVLKAEEQSRRQAALHEQRVANLEARLAELSSTVGSYDRLRQQDQDNIYALKKQLMDINPTQTTTQTTKKEDDLDMPTLVDELVRLKKLLVTANSRSANPLDLSQVLTLSASASENHVQCEQQLQSVQQLLDTSIKQRQLLEQKCELQQSHIQTLQEKVQVLNRNIDEAEQELKHQGEKLRMSLKQERSKWQEAKAELENETRCKLNELEQLLQKQRQRSLQLLDEKEQEIKTLKTSFEVFHHQGVGVGAGDPTTPSVSLEPGVETVFNYSSDADSVEGERKVKSKKLSLSDNCHMLHYANELARKDIEISSLRKAKYSIESTLRKAIQDKVTSQQEMHEKIECLEEQVDRLERCQTREGANLEYLKNVIISYIVTKDLDGKRHMLNAISAVLQFTPSEMQAIQATFQKK